MKTPGPHRKPRPPRAVPLLVRDVGVGLLIAAVVLGLYAGGRRLLSDSGSPRLAAADTGPAGGAAPAQTPGVLVIDEATPRHGVRVDGEALDVDLTRDAIPLEPGREHAVEVVLGDRVVERFVITVDPAQAVRRAIEIESSERAPARDQGGRDSRRAATTEAAAAESAGDTPERRSGDSAQALPRSPR